MITYSKLGHARRGRLGNHLFQIASTIGLGLKYGHDRTFPDWPYNQYFEKPLPTGGRFEAWELPEKAFTFQEEDKLKDRTENFDVDGWRQSEKYWEGQEWYIRSQFTFTRELQKKVRQRFRKALSRPAIAISVRRGDFVGNPNYYQLPVRYYLLALFEGIPDWEQHNVIIFSDDLAWCRIHFEGVPGISFAEGTDIEQLCLMSMCQHFIISNSTFSWWGAWLGEKDGSIVIRPARNFAGPLAAQNSEQDYWPARWKIQAHEHKRLNLKDVTFTIPVFVDHRHRTENVNLCVAMLQEDFDTNIVVGEQGKPTLQKLGSVCRYHFFTGMQWMHRTKMLNDMARCASTPIVVNWDADVFIPPAQLWLAAERIRKGEDMVYPYDGRFARVPRVWFPQLHKSKDLGIFQDTQFTGKHGKPLPTTSVGGAIFFNLENFLLAGGENEYMVSFGPEDWERNYRFNTLGYTVTRVGGALYHLDHWCGPNSSSRNPYFKHNHDELDKIRAMSEEELVAYVTAWGWR